MSRTATLESHSEVPPIHKARKASSGMLPTARAKPPLRVMIAAPDHVLRDDVADRLRDSYAVEVRMDVEDASEAAVALLLRHPDLVVCDVALPGHAQRGFRVVTEALMLGVPILLLCGSVQPMFGKRLAQLGVTWVSKNASQSVFLDGAQRALRGRGELVGIQAHPE